jgi:hypothetical protein
VYTIHVHTLAQTYLALAGPNAANNLNKLAFDRMGGKALKAESVIG